MQVEQQGIVVDLFSGAGGFHVAGSALGVEMIGVENDPDACSTARAAGFKTMCADVTSVPPRLFGDSVWGLVGAPPCQPFSNAGKGKGKLDRPLIERFVLESFFYPNGHDRRTDYLSLMHDARSLLVVEPLRWAMTLRPRWICLEQVPAVLPLWELYCCVLRCLGYSAWCGKLLFEQFGVPQTRKRAILMASLDREVHPPAPTHSRYYERDPARLDDGVPKWVSMAEALGLQDGPRPSPSPTITAGGSETDGAGTEVFSSASRRRVDKAIVRPPFVYRSTTMENSAQRGLAAPAPTIAFGNDAASAQWVQRSGQSVAGEGRAERSVDEPSLSIIGRTDLSSWVYERPSFTVVTSRRSSDGMLIGKQLAYGEGRNIGGKNWVDGEVSGIDESKVPAANACRVSVEEAAQLQTFPVGYPWQGPRSKRYRQVGNAFAPLMAYRVLEALLA